MRRIEDDDQPREDYEHTREAYADTADLVRALEKSGALVTRRDFDVERVRPSEV